MSYCTADEVREMGTGLTTSAPVPLDEDLLVSIIDRCSRYFDRLCGVAPGYFEPLAANAVATPQTFYSDGGGILALPPYVSGSLNTTIGLPDGYSAQTFIERDGYLVRADTNGVVFSGFNPLYGGWYQGVPMAITAKWGYAATPADVKMAVIELAINVFRETDPAGLRLTNLDGSVLRERTPPRVDEIARRYRRSETKAVFV